MGALEEWIAEMFLTHSLNLLRFSAGTQDKILALMGAMSKELTAKLNEGEISTYGKQRLGALLRESNALISSHYTGMQAELTRNLTGMVRIEADYTAKVLTQGLKIKLGAKLPPATYLEKLVGDTLIKGASSADWWKRQALDTQFRFASQVRLGAAQGETTSQIVSRVLGKSAKAADLAPSMPATPPMPAWTPSAPAAPAAKGPTPAPDPVAPGEQGILKASSANARALVHSSVQAVANAARLASFQRNAELIECLVWLSTLDSHTCLLCAMRDLHEYSLHDQEPINHNLQQRGRVLDERAQRLAEAEERVAEQARENGIAAIRIADQTAANEAEAQRLRGEAGSLASGAVASTQATGMSKEQLQGALDSKGIKYPAAANKAELQALLGA
ncbi:hypothetical protein P9875_17735 [Janthinobacterium rivuli]|uniref:Uncharacterized protein n=1 Tax=Janthinobacterium rivuli TaxID=2751478 RepID=A0ABY8HY53_9BURK|nr:hypothetical protein [Janthinobacterium rivuli]WFR77565.1 hypothetical protein P9875_17735 [Janthinobacterium rivuli]